MGRRVPKDGAAKVTSGEFGESVWPKTDQLLAHAETPFKRVAVMCPDAGMQRADGYPIGGRDRSGNRSGG